MDLRNVVSVKENFGEVESAVSDGCWLGQVKEAEAQADLGCNTYASMPIQMLVSSFRAFVLGVERVS